MPLTKDGAVKQPVLYKPFKNTGMSKRNTM